MENISEKFVEKLYTMASGTVPVKVTDKARECFADYVSVVMGGCKTYSEKNTDFIFKNKMVGNNHVFGINESVDLRTAIMINAFNAHILELDDSHRSAMTHLGAPIFSALLGVAELYGNSVNDLLKGAVIGYEAAIRLANAIQPGHKKRGFHVSGTCCTVGCAMGIAAMLGFSKEEMSNVFSASVTSAAGLLAVISGRSEQKPYNISNAAIAGTDAALYGKYFTGAVDILCDNRGFFHAVSDDYNADKLFENGYAIEGIYQKLYAACRHCHAPMEAMMTVVKNNPFHIDDIESITVETYDLAINGHDHTKITGISSAKQSIPYGVTAAVLFNDCSMNAFSSERVAEIASSELIKKISVKEDTELTKLVPGVRAAVVRVKLKDKREFFCRTDFAKGEPENPITADEWVEKFNSLMLNSGKDKPTAKRVYDFLQTGDSQPVKTLFEILN